ncbi:MAG TPA: manganese efflux pump MntP family protein [Sphingomonas sp.]
MSGFLTLGALGLGLSVDAFAAAVCKGAGTAERPRLIDALRIGIVFGIFEAIMPAVGWLIGRGVTTWFDRIGSWVAFALLVGVGGHMIWQAWRETDAPEVEETPRNGNLIGVAATAVATSLDALAVGVSIAVLGISLIATCLTTFTVTTLVASGGVIVGHRAGVWLGRYAEIGGGAVLVLIGVAIIGQHLFAG